MTPCSPTLSFAQMPRPLPNKKAAISREAASDTAGPVILMPTNAHTSRHTAIPTAKIPPTLRECSGKATPTMAWTPCALEVPLFSRDGPTPLILTV